MPPLPLLMGRPACLPPQVLEYTQRGAGVQLEEALEAWEAAAGAVTLREQYLQQLVAIKQHVTSSLRYSLAQQQQQILQAYPPGTPMASAVHTRLREVCARLEELGPAVGISQPAMVDMVRAFLAATAQVEQAGAQLREVYGHELAVGGAAYPGEGALSVADLQEYLRLVLPHCYQPKYDDDDLQR
jgi:hypothetical protein